MIRQANSECLMCGAEGVIGSVCTTCQSLNPSIGKIRHVGNIASLALLAVLGVTALVKVAYVAPVMTAAEAPLKEISAKSRVANKPASKIARAHVSPSVLPSPAAASIKQPTVVKSPVVPAVHVAAMPSDVPTTPTPIVAPATISVKSPVINKAPVSVAAKPVVNIALVHAKAQSNQSAQTAKLLVEQVASTIQFYIQRGSRHPLTAQQAHDIKLQLRNKCQSALTLCDKALTSDPQNAIAWNQKARALYYLDRKSEAQSWVDRAIILFPKDAGLISAKKLIHS